MQLNSLHANRKQWGQCGLTSVVYETKSSNRHPCDDVFQATDTRISGFGLAHVPVRPAAPTAPRAQFTDAGGMYCPGGEMCVCHDNCVGTWVVAAPTLPTRWPHQNTCTGPLTDRDRGVSKWPHLYDLIPGGFGGRPPPLGRPHGNPEHNRGSRVCWGLVRLRCMHSGSPGAASAH